VVPLINEEEEAYQRMNCAQSSEGYHLDSRLHDVPTLAFFVIEMIIGLSDYTKVP
jgi:hypothetical protein